jgi:hypothetical protein
MPNNNGKKAVAGVAAAAALGGAALISKGGDDAVRAGRAAEEVRPAVDLPTPRPELPTPQPEIPVAVGTGSTENLVREGQQDATKKDVICFAYETFYDDDVGGLALPSQAEFVEAVLDAVVPRETPLGVRLKAESLYETLSDPDADLVSVSTEMAC